ncbi:dimethylarginine dimethylaminohydrolase family protein [Bacillus marasmi]|uniref:dimethylarginine dimethylaminohydrolase family protein n=1 Tax=Bacillus marasmi TaxID=1926279 RepID=UPI0011CC7100|nr:arginine deiminase family protein [Bacillus marasmi]
MTAIPESNHHAHCANEYDPLKRVILCQPNYMSIREMGNKPVSKTTKKGIDLEKAIQQHEQFVKTLKDNGVEVNLLPHHKKYPEQVYTRDIGFTLGQTIFVAKIASPKRRGEENILKQWLDDEEISYYVLAKDHIEGGDVLIDRENIFVGLSGRTHQQAINHLQSLLTQYKIKSIPFHERFLHLDCVLNIIARDVAILYPPALTKEDITFLSTMYRLIEVTDEEQRMLGTNVLNIGNNKIISLPENENVNNLLQRFGYQVIEVEFSEIVKAGGSFRCCTLPILR